VEARSVRQQQSEEEEAVLVVPEQSGIGVKPLARVEQLMDTLLAADKTVAQAETRVAREQRAAVAVLLVAELQQV
jgi:hypothetical protein